MTAKIIRSEDVLDFTIEKTDMLIGFYAIGLVGIDISFSDFWSF